MTRDYLVWTTDHFDASERQVIVDGIRAWNAVVAQTSTARRRHFREYAIDHDTGAKTGQGYGRARVNLKTQDGPETHISILRAHDYTVLDADFDAGLLLRNPFGRNLDLDRHMNVDAAFWMSWDDAERYIGDVVVSRGF